MGVSSSLRRPTEPGANWALFGSQSAQVDEWLKKFEPQGLIEVPTYTLAEYRLHRSSVSSLAKEEAETNASIPKTFTLTRKPVSAPAAKSISFSLKKQGAGGTGPLRLQPLLDPLIAQAGGGLLGQIAVYQALRKLDAETLQKMNFSRLNLVDSTYHLPSEEVRREVLAAICPTNEVVPG